MSFRPADFKTRFLGGAVSVLCLSAAAQNGAPPASKPIIFSAPAGDTVGSNAPSFASQLSSRPNFLNDVRAPVSVFGVESPAPPSPVLPRAPTLSRAEARRLQKMLDERENWALLTPEEILGLDVSRNAFRTPEQEAGADGQRNLTVVERFLERQRQPRTAATNGYTDDSSPGWDLSGARDGPTNGIPFSALGTGLPTTKQIWDRLFNDAPANDPFARRDGNRDVGWFKTPGQPTQPAAPTPEQLAERERFKQLLDPGSYTDMATKSAPGGKSLSAQQSWSDATLDQTPSMNPLGASLTPLSSGISRPAGLVPLPGIAGPTNWQSSASLPSGALQPPPWLSQTPQPFTVPQRKF